MATPQCATNVGAITVQFSSLIDATGVLVAILRMHAAELRLQVRYTQVEQIKVGHYLEIQAPGGLWTHGDMAQKKAPTALFSAMLSWQVVVDW